MAWVSWKKMSVSKQQGGLGFRDLQQFNQALLANQYWKIAHRPNSLLFRVLKNRYFRNGSIWNATKGHQASYGWQSLLYGKELLSQGYQCGIGNGSEFRNLIERPVVTYNTSSLSFTTPVYKSNIESGLLDQQGNNSGILKC
ncbi:uncharacterized mitochondrial protein AtMg00310-like [Raphanus sativus]|uniref:Uncharacterized mitochondrial protein AtMg00310-like n=1 Tax=Raphanus sativus TaxID=3726 RepID=A0A9W3BUJ4_RAPSA|nr:uncharacterized mitochondrial protein AtMg00310-like [Raphanus sativus]